MEIVFVKMLASRKKFIKLWTEGGFLGKVGILEGAKKDFFGVCEIVCRAKKDFAMR